MYDSFSYFLGGTIAIGVIYALYVYILVTALSFIIETVSSHKYRLKAHTRLFIHGLGAVYMSFFLTRDFGSILFGGGDIFDPTMASYLLVGCLLSLVTAKSDKLYSQGNATNAASAENSTVTINGTADGAGPLAANTTSTRLSQSALRYLIPAVVAAVVIILRPLELFFPDDNPGLELFALTVFVFSWGALITDIIFGVSRQNKLRFVFIGLATISTIYISSFF